MKDLIKEQYAALGKVNIPKNLAGDRMTTTPTNPRAVIEANEMPEVIYATPRGSGTISGVYVDFPVGDEPRGEHKYVKASCHLDPIMPDLLAALDKCVEALERAEHCMNSFAKNESNPNECVADNGMTVWDAEQSAAQYAAQIATEALAAAEKFRKGV